MTPISVAISRHAVQFKTTFLYVDVVIKLKPRLPIVVKMENHGK